MAEFPTVKGTWPWSRPWIGSYCIPSCISLRPLPMYQISLKSKKFFMDGRTDIWDPLLGWLGGVNLKTKDRYSRLLRHPAWTKRWECVNCRELTGGGLADSCSRLWISERSSVKVVSNWPACRSVMSTVSGDHSSRRPSTSRWSRCSCRNTSRTSCLNYTRTHTHMVIKNNPTVSEQLKL